MGYAAFIHAPAKDFPLEVHVPQKRYVVTENRIQINIDQALYICWQHLMHDQPVIGIAADMLPVMGQKIGKTVCTDIIKTEL